MFRELSKGIYKETSAPVFGKQDIGISPAGAMDLFSYSCGNSLLNNPADAEALELVYPPKLEVLEDCLIILTGGAFQKVTLRSETGTAAVEHGKVVLAEKGSTLEFGPRKYGFRSYLCYRSLRGISKGAPSPAGRKRAAYSTLSGWRDPEGAIRVIRGPEYGYLKNPELFLNEGWTLTQDISDMGMRLSCGGRELDLDMPGNMISEAVSDGTVQLTPKGPIILLKHRQTVGGYPRIFNVITADVDMLAQYSPAQVVHFKEVSPAEAYSALKAKNEALEGLL
ncbi:MAG: hypothetical protein PQJ50_14220 [Spirochaetales bacterium]|nr:hypothetical protein [Spirochaetales bacterium]